jgi:hypothetical protein
MPLQETQRLAYMQLAGLTEQQIEQAIGSYTVPDLLLQATGLARSAIDAARGAIRQLSTDVTIITAKYNALAQRSGGDPRHAVDAAELAADRAALEDTMTEVYSFVTPTGETQDRGTVIDSILGGKLRLPTLGRGGYHVVSDSLQVHGDTAVLTSTIEMSAPVRLAELTSGAAAAATASGTYRLSNTYVQAGGRWQLTSGHLSQVSSH